MCVDRCWYIVLLPIVSWNMLYRNSSYFNHSGECFGQHVPCLSPVSLEAWQPFYLEHSHRERQLLEILAAICCDSSWFPAMSSLSS